MVQEGEAHPQRVRRQWNEMMLTRGPSTPDKQKYFNKLRDAVDPSRTDLTAWSDLQDLEEGRTVPATETNAKAFGVSLERSAMAGKRG